MHHDQNARRIVKTCALILLASVISGCTAVTSGLKQAVIMEYDQRHNFGSYTLQNPVPNGNGSFISSVQANGFWAFFIVCTLRNESAEAQPFPYDANKFYVDINGQKFFHTKLQSTQWSHPNGIITSFAEDAFDAQTTLPAHTQTFPVGFNASLSHRFAIFIPTGAADAVDATRLTLRYDGYPNILTSRNQSASQLGSASAGSLINVCRPQAQ